MNVQNYAQAVVARFIPVGHYLCMENLAHIRELRGLSQQQLADRIGANQATISKIESGAGNPTLSMINRIAKALDVEPNQLFSMGQLQQRLLAAIAQIDDPAKREAAVIVIESMALNRQ